MSQTNIEWLREKAEVGISMWKNDRELGARLTAIADELERTEHLQRQLDQLAKRYNELGREHVAVLKKSGIACKHGYPVDHCGECL